MSTHDGTTRTTMVEAAARAVSAAAGITRSVQNDLAGIRAMTKDDRSPVTVADFAAQAMVVLSLRESLGALTVVGEEDADELRRGENGALRDSVIAAVRSRRPETSDEEILAAIDDCDHDGRGGFYWTLDPVDGTKGFLNGRQYAISLGFIEDGEVVLGALACPNLPLDPGAGLDRPEPQGTVFTAVRGAGAAVRSDDPDGAGPSTVQRSVYHDGDTVHLCESVEKGHSDQSRSARVMTTLGIPFEPARLDSQAKYAVVARGQADVYLRLPTSATYVERIWDHAAGMLIATEAGATVTDVNGTPLDFSHGAGLEVNRGVVCAAPELHGRLLEAIAAMNIGAST